MTQIKNILGPDFDLAWPTLQAKFKQDKAGKFYNWKLKKVMREQKAYSKKQSERVKKRWFKKDDTTVSTTVQPRNIPKREYEYEDEKELGIENKKSGGKGPMVISLPPTKEKAQAWAEGALADMDFMARCSAKHGNGPPKAMEAVKEFFQDKFTTGKWQDWKNEPDMRSNLLYWMEINGEKQRNKKNGTAKNNGNLGPTGVKVDPYAEFGTV